MIRLNEAFKTIIDNIHEGVIILNEELIFTYANKASNAFGFNEGRIKFISMNRYV